MSRRFVVLTIVLVVMCSACSWAQFRGGAARTGSQASESKLGLSTLGSVHEAWTANVNGSEYVESPAVAGGVLYVVGTNTGLLAFDAKGTESCAFTPKRCDPLWTAPMSLPGAPVFGTPAISPVGSLSSTRPESFSRSMPRAFAGVPVHRRRALRCGPLQ
jgi:hypothetical protein